MTKPQLFMFHFAGGNCYSYNFMISVLNSFKVETIELPGRGTRSNEALLTDFNEAAKNLYKQVKDKLISKDFLIYGHSMGASLALKVTKMLEQENLYPLCLIVTGNPGPGISKDKKRYLLNNKDFVSEVNRLGGLPSELLENQDLLDYFIPILRADFEISEKNNLGAESIVSVPIYSIMGNLEENHDHINNWAIYTKSSFNYEILKGNHFFIYKNQERISEIIKKCYNNKYTILKK